MQRISPDAVTAVHRYAATLVGALAVAVTLLGVQAAAPAPALAMTNAEDCSDPGEILFMVEPDGNCVYDGGGGSGGDSGGGNADGGGGDSADDSSGTGADDQGADSGSAAEDPGADQPDAVSGGDDSDASRIAEAEQREKELSDREMEGFEDADTRVLEELQFFLADLNTRCQEMNLDARHARELWNAKLFAEAFTNPGEDEDSPAQQAYLREYGVALDGVDSCLQGLDALRQVVEHECEIGGVPKSINPRREWCAISQDEEDLEAKFPYQDDPSTDESAPEPTTTASTLRASTRVSDHAGDLSRPAPRLTLLPDHGRKRAAKRAHKGSAGGRRGA